MDSMITALSIIGAVSLFTFFMVSITAIGYTTISEHNEAIDTCKENGYDGIRTDIIRTVGEHRYAQCVSVIDKREVVDLIEVS